MKEIEGKIRILGMKIAIIRSFSLYLQQKKEINYK